MIAIVSSFEERGAKRTRAPRAIDVGCERTTEGLCNG